MIAEIKLNLVSFFLLLKRNSKRLDFSIKSRNLLVYNPSYLLYKYLHNVPKINMLEAIYEGYLGILVNITLQKSMRFESLIV